MAFTDTQPRTRVRLTARPPLTQPPRLRRRLMIVAVALGALVLVAVVLAVVHRSPHARSTEQATPPQPSANTPSVVAGVSVGYPDSSAGAEAAAANYVVAFAGESMFNAATRHQIIGAVADPTVAAALQQQYDAAFQATMSRFGLSATGQPPRGQQLVARALPVGVHVDAYTPDTARVSVWSDGLIGLAGSQSRSPVAEAWTTTTVSLHWVDGDWKWVTATQHDGPTPVAGLQSPSTSEQIAQATQTFTGMRYGP
jgi:hypothetical protein